MSSNEIRTPLATYRVQLTQDFDLRDAAQLVDYLQALGVTHLYVSPYLHAERGSGAGYDVTDHQRVDDKLGGEAARQELVRALAERGMGQVLDIVPNHMAIDTRNNRFWWDVLENGRASPYAEFFDIHWNATGNHADHRILLPVLGDHYGCVLEAGQIKLEREGATFVAHYYEHQFPIALETMAGPLRAAAERSNSDTLAFLADSLARLVTRENSPDGAHWYRNKQVLRAQLMQLLAEQPMVSTAVDAALTELNNNHDQMDRLLRMQHYRLAYWHAGADELNFRRFFDIDQLAALHVENPRVFDHTHALVLDWIRRGEADGLRIDHANGLYDAEQYLWRLRQRASDAWIVVEKIMEPGEHLPDTWPVQGTTGYDFLGQVNGLSIDPAGEEPLTRLYAELTGEPTDYQEIVHQAKLDMLHSSFGGEVQYLTSLLSAITRRHRRFCDLTARQLREGLEELEASFPVRRPHIRAEAGQISEQDARHVQAATQAASQRRPDLDAQLWECFQNLLLLKWRGELETRFVMAFQQFITDAGTMGTEDTAFYRYNRLVSLCEVGANPAHFAVSPDEFHAFCAYIQEHWPHTMLTTSTHDTKRSEDVRLRINLLSEIPQAWEQFARRCFQRNARHRQNGMPSRNAEYLLYQTLVGSWPIALERIQSVMLKAACEAKQETAWRYPNPAYENALKTFVEAVWKDEAFVDDLARFVAPLVEPARISSLAETLIKCTAPGIPDIYQGTELWALNLVDPDNRRPVDFALRRDLLDALEHASLEEILRRMDEGLPKLFVIHRALKTRHRLPHLFGPEATYRPLQPRGEKAPHLVAFQRGKGLITVVPRLLLGLGGDWGATTVELPRGTWVNQFTDDEVKGGTVRLDELFARFPVALLVRKGET
jgi:(1->4)-alpha-D-glucan 1-alpha-D-glucosylmutase